MRIFILMAFSFIYLFSITLEKKGDVVIDNINHLMWQDTQDNIRILKTHSTIQTYCDKLRLNDYINWRVPSVSEYKYIIDKNRKHNIAKINKAFKYTLLDNYWTDDRTWRNLGKYGYYVYFKSGTIYYQNRTYKKLVRCVRDIK
jgi:hypothetical protein